jgi:hypothetical protein
MEEYTNSTEMQEVGLFDDYEPETTGAEETTDELKEQETPEAKETEAAEVEDKPAEEPEKEPEKPQTIRVKYNGEEKDVSIEEATTLVQKGMNYDKVVSERDKLRDSEAMKALKFFADMSGQSVDDYSKFLVEQQEQILVQNEAEAITKAHPEWSEDAINELAASRANKKMEELKTSAAKREEQQKQKELEPWIKFLDKYPEYKRVEGQPEKPIPPEVLKDVENGLTPIEAMSAHLQKNQELDFKKKIEEYDAKLAALEKNKKNKETALPSASGVTETPEDSFLKGLFG